MDGVKELAATEGIFACPEGGAALAAYQELLEEGFLKESDEVVLFNTGSGYKYLDTFADYWGVEASRRRSSCRRREISVASSGRTDECSEQPVIATCRRAIFDS